MPLPSDILEDIGRRRSEAQLDAARVARRTWVTCASLCLLWSLLGLCCVGWSFHSTNMTLAQVAFWGGLLIADGGSLISFLVTWHRAEARGDLGPPL